MNSEQERVRFEQQTIRQSDVNLAELRADAARSVNAELIAEVAALRLSRDLARSQLAATIAERDAERALADALATALRGHGRHGATHCCGTWDSEDVEAIGRYEAARRGD